MNTRRFAGWLWLLSGVPVGVMLILLPPHILVPVFWTFVLLETAHTLSPITVAWGHGSFRQVMRERPSRYLLLPALALVVALSAPFGFVTGLYFSWNIFHFGMQNFGILSLCCRITRKVEASLICIALICALALLPAMIHHPQKASLFILGAITVNHWVVDLGLSSVTFRHAVVFLIGLVSVGMIGFLWEHPTIQGIQRTDVEFIVRARFGLGFIHFLYSGWVWKFSDPQVRTTIGRIFYPTPAVPGGAVPRHAMPCHAGPSPAPPALPSRA